MNSDTSLDTAESWSKLKTFTDARIGLGRTGVGQPLAANLDFRLAHAQARDAVKTEFQQEALVAAIGEFHPSVALESAAEDREMYLTRPDLGRKLSQASIERYQAALKGESFDIAIVVGDGLSARAIHENAVPFIRNWIETLQLSKATLRLAPIPVVRNSRVATADAIGELCNAKITLILIGERPGLSSPDSMGLYLTYEPKVGCTDERRNCISNIRCAGLATELAVRKSFYLVENALLRKVSGVELKDDMDRTYLPFSQ